jgi:cytosine/adenosine deaminase-related metal-dependent hydrolase
MSVPKVLRRLLRVRAIEEEQRRRALDAAVTKLQSLEQARESAMEMEKQGRARVGASVVSRVLADRQAGLVEQECARRRGALVTSRIAMSQAEASERRAEFLAKRVERRQAASLIEDAQARREVEAERQSQRSVDDWYGMAKYRQSEDQ